MDLRDEISGLGYDRDHYLIKEEKLPDSRKLILKHKKTGKIIQKEL